MKQNREQRDLHPSEGHCEKLLPFSNGKFAMWLFLSTEVMFFGGLFSAYIVLRSGLPEGVWPGNEAVHVNFWIGLVNTIILTASSIAAWFAVRMSVREQLAKCRFALLLAVTLGCIFLSIKGFEYQGKLNLGIFPRTDQRQIFDRADIYYLAAVRKDLDRQMQVLEGEKSSFQKTEVLLSGANEAVTEETSGVGKLDSQNRLERIEEKLVELYRIRSGLVLWTESQVAQSNDLNEQRKALAVFANQIYESKSESGLDLRQFESQQRSAISEDLGELEKSHTEMNDQLSTINQQISEKNAEKRELSQRPDPKSDEVKDQIKAVVGELTALQKQSGNLTQETSQIKQRMIPIENRIEFLDNGLVDGGLNHSASKWGLPMVIPGGGTWMNLYYLLTGLHAIHVLVGIPLLAYFLFPGATNRSSALHNVVLYWHFVDVVWLVVFAVIYLQ